MRSRSDNDPQYAFHPGQKPICQRQKRPTNDLGLLSYFALMGHSEHLCCAIVIYFSVLISL